MKRRGLALILVLIIGLLNPFSLPVALGAYESQTIHIVFTEDDGFIPPSTGIIDQASYLYTTEANVDIRSFWHFRDVDIERDETLNNATLRIRSGPVQPFDADSSFTLYGMELDNLQDSWRPLGGMIIALPKTSRFVNVNTSTWSGYQWHEIDVTEIVREITSRYQWDGDAVGTGDSIGFIGLGVQDDTRYFYDYSGSPTYSADLIINWGAHDNPPPTPPGSEDPEYNETYREIDIWTNSTDLGENRTGGPPSNFTADASGIHVNWNTVNLTDLTEFDPGNDINRQNDTWATITSMRKDAVGSLYNDTGILNITSFFARFAVNVSAVNSAIAGNDPIPGFMALSTSAPTGANGMGYGVGGDWIGLMLQVNQDDQRWRVYVRDRDGVADVVSAGSSWFYEDWPDILYFECMINTTAGYVNYNIYNDALYRDLNQTRSYSITLADAPFRYSQLVVGMAQAGGSTTSFQYYTFLEPVDLGANFTYLITWPNGTLIDTLPGDDDPEEWIDDYLNGSDPQDPEPPGQGYPEEGFFTRFKTRLYILILGLGCVLGPLFFLAMKYDSGISGGNIAGVFIVMLIGLGLMLAIRQI